MPDLGMSWKEALAYGEETSAKSHYIKDARLMAQQKYDLGRNSSWMFTKHGVPLQIRNMEKLKQFLDAGEQIHYQPVACYDGGDGSRTIQFFLNQIADGDRNQLPLLMQRNRLVHLLIRFQMDRRNHPFDRTCDVDRIFVQFFLNLRFLHAAVNQVIQKMFPERRKALDITLPKQGDIPLLLDLLIEIFLDFL